MRAKRRGFGGFVVLFLVAVGLSGCGWTMYGGNPGNTGQALDNGVNAANATQLTRQCRFHPGSAIEDTPVTYGSEIFLAAGNDNLYALDYSCRVLWSRPYPMQTIVECASPQGFISMPAVGTDSRGNPQVYVYTHAGTLEKVDGNTGNLIWSARVFDPAPDLNDYYPWASIMLFNGHVYVGTSSDCDRPFVRGGLKSFDQATGALVAEYDSMPNLVDPNYATRTYSGLQQCNCIGPPPTTNLYVGAGVWTTPSIGTVNGHAYVFVTTGSTYADSNHQHPPLDNNDFDQYSIVKLDADTLHKVGKFAVPQPQGIGDPDFGSTPVIFHATLNGADTPMAGACDKDGNFYAVRADTMRAVWAVHVGLGTAAGQTGCLARPVWDDANGRLFVTGNDTSVGGSWVRTTMTSASGYSWPLWTPSGGVGAVGSVRQLDPATGLRLGATPAPYWEFPLRSRVLAGCSLNGGGDVLACQTLDWTRTYNAMILVDPANGRQLAEYHDTSEWFGFSTPIFSNGTLIATDTDGMRILH